MNIQAEDLPNKMVDLGDIILKTDLSNAEKLTKQNFQVRKETKYAVKDGVLKLTPPKLAYGDKPPAKSKWAASTMSRMAFKEVIPQDYAVSFKFKLNKAPEGFKVKKYSFFFEFGHRCVRLQQGQDGTKLLIMNHLMKEEPQEKLLMKNESFRLEPEKWYKVFAEIKGEEIIVQVNDKVFYGKDSLIKNERPKAFQLNCGGAGFELDDVTVWKVGSFKKSWDELRKTFAQTK